MKLSTTGAFLLLSSGGALAQSCANILQPSYDQPVVGSGWTSQLVANKLTSPRGIIFDSSGSLLVVEKGVGISRWAVSDNDFSCLETARTGSVVQNKELNHGIALSNDGKTLYASTDDKVFAWAYNPVSSTVSGEPAVVVNSMAGTGHSTRTLLMSSKHPGMLLVSKGSGENVDGRARDISTGISQIRAFDMNNVPSNGYHFASQGIRLGWGLRNSVGIAEEPLTGGIFSVENSVDELQREGQDVHQNNPGEEMNFLGFLNGSTEHQGGNYGYPDCFALWGTDPSHFKDVGAMQVGDQFSPVDNSTLNDTICHNNHVAPRLTFFPHMAPLDMIFTPDGTEAYVTFHGSWNRDQPAGYKVSAISFANGQPIDAPNSKSSTRDIFTNANITACPDACFRPVGLTLDLRNRLWMSSDTTGDLYVLVQAEMTATGG